MRELLQREGRGVFTKGILARVGYTTAQSIVLFNLVKYIGKVFDV